MPAQMNGHVTTSNAFAVQCSHGLPGQNSRQFGMTCKAQCKQAHTMQSLQATGASGGDAT